jgi:ABC-type Zn uptake system ZnuABC Zn-binding protein ZnuA
VVASIYPLGDVARQIGGEVAQVEILVPPGSSPHGYRIRPGQAELLARADLLLLVGLGLDAVAERSASAAGRVGLRRLVLSEVAGLKPPKAHPTGDHQSGPEAEERAHEHHHAPGSDPHLWLDPLLMDRYVAEIGAVLCELRPGRADELRARTDRYRQQIAELHAACEARLGGLQQRVIVTLHAAFGHFAARYGLEEVAIFSAHMREPDTRTLERVLETVQRHQLQVIFVQPQVQPAQTAWLREQTGVGIAVLDPLGHPTRPGYGGYLETMWSNLRALEAGLGAVHKGATDADAQSPP